MRARVAISLSVTGLLLLAMAASAQAAITVSSQNDSGPGSLRQTVAEAPPGATIVLPAGTYTLTSAPLSIKEKSVTIAGHAAADTIIRAGGAFRVVEIVGPADVTLSGVTIRDGNISAGPAEGVGIRSIVADLTLRNSVVTNNTASLNGAPGNQGGMADGIGIYSVSGRLTMDETSVTNNTASVVGGSEKQGGIAEGIGIFAIGNLRIANSTISGNRADARGGQGSSNASQNGGIAEGGGIFIVQTPPASSSIVGTTISGNVIDGSGGPGGNIGIVEAGGVFDVSGESPTTISNSTVASNVARGLGTGGIVEGGGVYVVGGKPGFLDLLSTTISGNAIDTSGGGGLVEGGNLYAVNATFRNTIVAGGSGPPATANCFVALTQSLGFNLDSVDQCGFHSPGDLVNRDPLLGPLQNNGGPTQTMLPAANSPVVDQGSGTGLTDQRGVVRPIDFPSIANAAGGDGSDIGAVELQPSNALKLGKLKKNKKKGTATLTVTLPQPSAGTLVLNGSGLKKQTKAVAGEASIKLTVATKGGAAKSLRKKGKRKVKLEVTYTPTGNTAATKSRSTTLKRKQKAKKKS
jgi:hypothetical protein